MEEPVAADANNQFDEVLEQLKELNHNVERMCEAHMANTSAVMRQTVTTIAVLRMLKMQPVPQQLIRAYVFTDRRTQERKFLHPNDVEVLLND